MFHTVCFEGIVQLNPPNWELPEITHHPSAVVYCLNQSTIFGNPGVQGRPVKCQFFHGHL